MMVLPLMAWAVVPSAASAALDVVGPVPAYRAPSLTELCDRLGAANFSLSNTCDVMVETRDASCAADASALARAVRDILDEMCLIDEYEGRIPAAVEDLKHLAAENEVLVQRLGDRIGSYCRQQKALRELLAEYTTIVNEGLEIMDRPYPVDSYGSDVVYALGQAHVAAVGMPWGVGREAMQGDVNAGQKVRKALIEARLLLADVESTIRAQLLAKNTSVLSSNETQSMADRLSSLTSMLDDVEELTYATYDTEKAFRELYAQVSANVYTIDKYIFSELLGLC
ncbi:MAG: hypothetical protein GX620_16885, partial [Chloroflexi bacterium]|nr:hypothetical protein [Chloroflexota bacterium]